MESIHCSRVEAFASKIYRVYNIVFKMVSPPNLPDILNNETMIPFAVARSSTRTLIVASSNKNPWRT